MHVMHIDTAPPLPPAPEVLLINATALQLSIHLVRIPLAELHY